MRLLSLLRHAKSSWDENVSRDFDRPLNNRGRRAARAMGRFIAEEGLVFDSVLASPAVRVAETVALVEEGLGRSLEAREDRRIYMASGVSLLELVQGTADAGHLRVTFFWPFFGDYRIVHLGADYRTAIVTGPDYDWLWILTRERTIDEAERQALIDRAVALGFDRAPMRLVRHDRAPAPAAAAP